MMGPPSKWTGSMNFNAERPRRTQKSINVMELGRQVTTPTLVLRARDDDAVAAFEEGSIMATAFPCTRFIALQRRNHIVL